jgi:hypothetical protein
MLGFKSRLTHPAYDRARTAAEVATFDERARRSLPRAGLALTDAADG